MMTRKHSQKIAQQVKRIATSERVHTADLVIEVSLLKRHLDAGGDFSMCQDHARELQQILFTQRDVHQEIVKLLNSEGSK